MNWVRSHNRHGVRLALFALAVQFVLSFGHFHGIAAEAASAIGSPATSNAAYQWSQPSPLDPDQHQPSYNSCDICGVIALANAALSPAPPLLVPPAATTFLYLKADSGFVHSNSPRGAFQPRAPPHS
jgi:hypothetical protein